MKGSDLLAPIFFVIISLIAGAFLKYILKKTPLPYSVGLFVFGILIGLLARSGIWTSFQIINDSIRFAANMNPELILYLFLPVLIFDAAYSLDVHIFKKTLTNATLLAVPGMVVATFLTALLMMGVVDMLPDYAVWTWKSALMFGALISATDPVAVVALLKELGVNKRFSTLVDGESMLNDGTGIVLFMLFFGTFVHSGPSLSPVVDFILVVAGGALLGALIGGLCIIFIKRVHGDVLIQNSIIIVAAYFTFLVAQSYLNVSGVIALVGFGLIITYYGRSGLSSKVNRFMQEFWELATYIANTLIFIIVGVVIALKVDFTLSNLITLIVVYLGINLIRALMVALFYPLMVRSGYGISKREAVVLSWGGLRGALGLTLALMVSYTSSIPEPVRKQVLFLTGGVVTLTLLINATTVRWLLNRLGLSKSSSARLLLNYNIRKTLQENAESYFQTLRKSPELQLADWEIVKKSLPREEKAPDISAPLGEVIANFRLRILDKEKSHHWSLFADGIISAVTMRRLNSTTDELHDQNGIRPLTERGGIFDFPVYPAMIHKLRLQKVICMWFERYHIERLADNYDLILGFIITQKAVSKLVENFQLTDRFSEEEKDALCLLTKEVDKNIADGEHDMVQMEEKYPAAYRRAITHKTVRLLLVYEKRDIEMRQWQGLIALDDAQVLIDDLERKYKGMKM